jgi:hypothetical protein
MPTKWNVCIFSLGKSLGSEKKKNSKEGRVAGNRTSDYTDIFFV